MSQNLVGIVKAYKGKYYIFPETAEEVVGDERLDGEKFRFLEITRPSVLGPYNSAKEVFERGEEDFYDGYFEYGLSTSSYIDDVELVLTYRGERVKEDKIEDKSIFDFLLEKLNLEEDNDKKKYLLNTINEAAELSGVYWRWAYDKKSNSYKEVNNE